MKSWVQQLNPASFRGIRFGVLGGEARFGRRVAEHEYPGKDKPYIEDMGRATRRINLVGFLVENSLIYGGYGAIEQRDLMIGAAEKAGPGTLIHPTLGQLTVSIPEGGLGIVERWDEGRYFELHFSFIESGDRVFPTAKVDHRSLLELMCTALGIAAVTDFVESVQAKVSAVFKAIKMVQGVITTALEMVESVISAGQSVVNAVVDTVAGFQVFVGRIAKDASSISALVGLLSGDFGRYSSQSISSALKQSQSSSGGSRTSSSAARLASSDTATQMAALVADGAAQREAVTAAAAALATAAASFSAETVQTFAEAAQALVAAVAAGIPAPADKIRLLSELASFTPTEYASTSQIGQAKTVAAYVTASLLRRAAIVELARAAGDYAPSSYDDAATVRDTVVAFIDAEMLIAGDMSDDATYGALRSLRQAVIADLEARGASLAPLETFTVRDNLPSLVLANRLYQDPTRSDELIGEADPIHPAFMPSSFRALAS